MKKSFPIKIVTFFHSIEKNIWGEDINANPCFATISILLATLVAAITTGGNIINSWFDTDLQCSWYITMTILLFIMVLNVLESILAAENAKVATLRCLLVIGCMIGGALVGALTSVVVAIILAIAAVVLFLYLLLGALSGAASGGSKKGEVELKSDDIIDFMLGQDKISGTLSSDGLTFDGNNGKSYVRESTSSNDWYEKN
jgi:hypothetical protein